jgi:hypothetical protein
MKKLVIMCFVAVSATIVQAADNTAITASNCFQVVALQNHPDYYGEVPVSGQVIMIVSNTVKEVLTMGAETNKIAKRTIIWVSQLGGGVHTMKTMDYYPPNNTSVQGVATTGVYEVGGTYPDLIFVKKVLPKKD